MISVRLSGCPSRCVQNLTVGFFSKTMVLSQIKLGILIATVELYAGIPMLVTFDLYLGYRSAYVQNWQFQYLRNRAHHEDGTWCGYKVHQPYVRK